MFREFLPLEWLRPHLSPRSATGRGERGRISGDYDPRPLARLELILVWLRARRAGVAASENATTPKHRVARAFGGRGENGARCLEWQRIWSASEQFHDTLAASHALRSRLHSGPLFLHRLLSVHETTFHLVQGATSLDREPRFDSLLSSLLPRERGECIRLLPWLRIFPLLLNRATTFHLAPLRRLCESWRNERKGRQARWFFSFVPMARDACY